MGAGQVRLSFRLVLVLFSTAILVSFSIVVGALTYSSYRRSSWGELVPMVLRETGRRVEQVILEHVSAARHVSTMIVEQVDSGATAPGDFTAHADRWIPLLEAFPSFTSIYIGLESTGEAFIAARRGDGSLTVRELRHNLETGELDLWKFRPEDYPSRPFDILEDQSVRDPRGRPWYLRARDVGRQITSGAYVFLDEDGTTGEPGITVATPLSGPGGDLIGVLGVDFSLRSLADIVQEIEVGQAGFAFAMERWDEEPWRLIAHPDPAVLIRLVPDGGEEWEMVPAVECEDARVREFVEELANHDSIPLGGSTSGLTFSVDGELHIGSATRVGHSPDHQRIICAALPARDVMGEVIRVARLGAICLLGFLAIAIVFSMHVARRITRRLEMVADETKSIGEFNLESKPMPSTIIAEVEQFSEAMEAMKKSLRNFGRYVPAGLVRELTQAGIEAELGGERRIMTVFFSDIAGFTGIAESLDPEVLVELLAEHNQVMSEEIQAAEGTIDKYIGDAVMAFWGAPHADSDHAEHACLAALRCQSRLSILNERWRSLGQPQMRCRIGIATGELIVGNMGSQERLNYTVLGDPVNLASRIEGLNRHCGTGILVADSTLRETEGRFVTRLIDRVRVKGRKTPLLVHQILGVAGETDDSFVRLAAHYTAALNHHFERDWDRAIGELGALLDAFPDDAPAKILLERCQQCAASPPPPDWDGVREFQNK